MEFIQLPSGKLKNVDGKTLKLTNIPRNHNVSTLFPQLKHVDDACDLEFQRKLIVSIENGENVLKYFLAPGKIGRHLQEEIDVQITDGRLNDAHVRNQLDPLYKYVLQR